MLQERGLETAGGETPPPVGPWCCRNFITRRRKPRKKSYYEKNVPCPGVCAPAHRPKVAEAPDMDLRRTARSRHQAKPGVPSCS